MPEKNEAEKVLPDLPREVREVLRSAPEVEFATVSADGMPINNPLFFYFGPSGRTIDVATGVAYPAKANRARRNPRVGMLFAPGIAAYDPVVKGTLPGQVGSVPGGSNSTSDAPVVLVAATAAIRDANIQANTDRYVREFLRDHPLRVPWEEDRKRVWYYARIYIECTPVRVLWWPRGLASGEPPRVWVRTDFAIAPASDPAPSSMGTPPKDWPAPDWKAAAQKVLPNIPFPTLTVVDKDGFPLPFPTLGARLTDRGFELDLPASLPWEANGRACLTFAVSATFLGSIAVSGSKATFTVDRLVGNLPLAGNEAMPGSSQQAKDALMERLVRELERRGQPVPEVRQT